MREIKFRALTYTSREWKYGLYSNYRKMPVGGYALINTCDGREWLCDIDTLGQYTGLHDKNGKEIYEGDIVKSDNECFFVVFEDGAFRIKSNKNTFYGTPLRQCIAKNMEAVGNIYENPELLEV